MAVAPIIHALPWAVDSIEPPAGMKDRVLARVLGVHEAAEAGEDSQLLAAKKLTDLPTATKLETASTSKGIAIYPVAARSRVLSWFTGGLAAAVLLLAITSGLLLQRVDRLDQEREALTAQVAEMQRQAGEDTSTGSPLVVNRVINLSPMNDLVAKGLATIVIDNKGMHLIVQAEQLPELQNEEAFQVWLLKGGRPVNAGTFLTYDGTGALYYSFESDDFDQIAITKEPDAKGQTPRGEVVLAAALPDV